jgi:bacteriocin-like protein
MDHDICELSFDELEQVSGGDLLNRAIDAAEKAIAGLGARLLAAVHTPIVPPTGLGF